MEANPEWKGRCSNPARKKGCFGQSIVLKTAHAKEGLEFELVGGRFLRLKSITSRIPLLVVGLKSIARHHYLEMHVGQYLISVNNCRGKFGSIRGMSFEDILEEFKVEPSSSRSCQVATSMRSSRLRLFFVRRPDVVFSNPVLAAELGLTEIVKYAEVVHLLLQYGAKIHSRPTDVGGWTRETPIETLSSLVVQCVYAHKKDENRSKKIHLLVKASGAKSSGELGRMFPLLGRASAYASAQVLWSFYLEQSAANGERAPLRRSKRHVVS